jgi:hypothetical protein
MTQTYSPMFDEDQVRYIIDSYDSHKQLGRELGCSAWLIAQIRYGTKYASILPDLERWEKKSDNGTGTAAVWCWSCIHCHPTKVEVSRGNRKTVARCGLGLPDPIKEGARFARFCSAYTAQPQETQKLQEAAS